MAASGAPLTAVESNVDRHQQLVDGDLVVAIDIEYRAGVDRRVAESDVDAGQDLVDGHDAVAATVSYACGRGR